MSELVKLDAAQNALAQAQTPEDIMDVEAKLNAIEHYMRQAGLYSTEEIRPVNETKMRARWLLGKALAKKERGAGRPSDNLGGPRPNFKAYIKAIGLKDTSAKEAQRIGTLPEADLLKALARTRDDDILNTYADLIDHARPYWYQASRKKKHQDIAEKATADPKHLGPFPLIYADPPWTFNVYSEKGKERTAEQHYPTLTDEEIVGFAIDGREVPDIAHADAALLLWCTSSNIHRALIVLEAWGFTYKSQAVWVKDKSGLGLVFRNKHEVLLYGTRGKMPGPQYQPISVFEYPRGRHSAKPSEIRAEIERMYPDFDETTRLELFARETVPGWSSYGYEARSDAA